MKTENGFIRIAKRKIRQAKLRRKIKKIRMMTKLSLKNAKSVICGG